jgi:hypothetical protein
MQYAASMKPFQRTKHGRDAWLALVRRGKAIFLEYYVAHHRSVDIDMTLCADQVQYQFPNERTRVAYIFDGIPCDDA